MDESVYRKYHSISSNEYPLFQNYQLVGDSQLVRFAELFLNSKRQYHQNSSGRVGYCIGGQTAQQLARNLEQKAWPVCRNVILLIGTNDINHNTDPSEWKATLVKIIAMFQQYRVDNVLLLTVPPVPKTWHTVEHWMLFVEYNETLKELETKYKDSFRSLQLLDISSIFFTKSTHSANCRDLYVVSPVREGMEHYDEEFMMSCSNSKKWSRGSKDNSYLRENISLFDTINMNYKLTNCVQGQTNDEDASINKDRFDLIGVTLTDVRNIKSKLLAINNEEYLYTLRHAFQKFLAHLKREMKEEKFESLYVSAYRDLSDDLVVQRKLPRSESYDAPGEDLETSGVLCRSLDASDTSGAYATPRVATTRHTTVATSAVTASTHSTAFSATSTFVAATAAVVSTSTPLPTIPPFTIKSEISLRRSLLTDTSPVSSRVKRRGSKDNVWFELSKQPDDKTTSSGSTNEGGDRTHDPVDANRGDTAETVDKLSTKGMHRRAVNSAMIPRQVVLKQNLGTGTRVHPSTSSDDTSSGVSPTTNRSPDMEIPTTGFKYLNSPVESERKDAASVSKKRSYEANVGRDTHHVTSEEIGAPPERKMKNRGESVTRSAHSSASNFSDSNKYSVDNKDSKKYSVDNKDSKKYSVDHKDSKKYVDMNDNKKYVDMNDNKKYVDMNDNKVPSSVEEAAAVLTIDYLTQEEKRDLEARLKKRAMKRDLGEKKYGKRPGGRQDGADRNFLQRLSAIQFYQFVQAVTRYESSHDMTPLMEKTFYLHLRNMRTTEGGDLESKFHHSMLGRYEFYKFMKYISLDYIVPKMFSNKFKKVMFTSQVDASGKQEKYAAKSLDISVFETHFSRLAHAPRHKPPRVDLVHFNQKGFELLRDYLSQAIGQMEQRDSDA